MAWSCCWGVFPEGPHPDHEELVQITGKDGGEFQTLQQGDALVPRLLQHPLVKAQPGQLPVLGVAGIHVFGHGQKHSFQSMRILCGQDTITEGFFQVSRS